MTINPWTEELIKKAERKTNPVAFDVVIQVDPKVQEQVKDKVRRYATVTGQVSGFIFARVPDTAALDNIARIPGVELVTTQKILRPYLLGYDFWIMKRWVQTDPLLSKLTPKELRGLGIEVKPAAEMLHPITAMLIPKIPFAPLPVMARAGWALVTQTRDLMDAPPDNKISGRTLVAVIDSGITLHPAMRKPFEQEVMTVDLPMDTMGHGCLSGSTRVYTSYCGVIGLEDLWNKIPVNPISVAGGEVKMFNKEVWTIGQTGIVRVQGVYRTRADKKVVIETEAGTLECTTWHKVFVVEPRRNSKPYDSHRRWHAGYEIKVKDANSIVPRGEHNLVGDWLFIPRFRETWHKDIDPELAYLRGLIDGDGTLLSGLHYGRWRYECMISDQNYAFLAKVGKLALKFGASSISIRTPRSEKGLILEIYGKAFTNSIVNLTLDEIVKDSEATRGWIAGFFDAEGNVSQKRNVPYVRITNANHELLKKVKDILAMLGIPCTICSGGISKGSKTYH